MELLRMRKTILAICFVIVFFDCPTAHTLSQSQKAEEISGAIVAYKHWLTLLPCYHMCRGSLIVRMDKSEKSQPQYIRIDFRYPDRHFPNELIASKRLWTFRLTRTKTEDDPIEKYIKSIDEKTGKEVDARIPAWKTIPGAENEELPFGE